MSFIGSNCHREVYLGWVTVRLTYVYVKLGWNTSLVPRSTRFVEKMYHQSKRYRPVLVALDRLRLMGKYIGHRLVPRPKPDNTFWTDSTRHELGDSPLLQPGSWPGKEVPKLMWVADSLPEPTSDRPLQSAVSTTPSLRLTKTFLCGNKRRLTNEKTVSWGKRKAFKPHKTLQKTNDARPRLAWTIGNTQCTNVVRLPTLGRHGGGCYSNPRCEDVVRLPVHPRCQKVGEIGPPWCKVD